MRPHLPILALVLSPFGIASSTGETVEPVAWLLSALASLALLAASFSSSGFILALIATASVFVTILIRDSVLDHPSETLIVGASWIAWTIAVSDHCKTKVLMLSMGSDYEAGRRSSDRAVGNREFLLTALGATAICGAFLWCEAIENKAIDWSATYGLGVVSIAYLAYLKTLTSLGRLSIILRIGLLVCGTAMVVTAHWFGLAIYASLAGCLVLIISSTIDRWSIFSGAWWSPIVNHPARLLAIPFLFACAIGTGLLLLPVSSTGSKLSILDAAFTSTSAVCVTGLIVKDTPTDFTMLGQIWIILLIQFGGLGMMTISSSVFQLLGRRMGIRQEKLLTSISQRPASVHRQSLFRVLKFTFVVELAGIVILSILFIDNGDRVVDAFWRATFTSISAFCNAGFALQTDSLVPYAGEPLILHTIGILIITGGLAPATVLVIPALLKRQKIPPAAYLALVYTLFFLMFGFVMILSLEWSRSLGDFGVFDKLNNAWFQSVTLRTAGFNSIDISQSAAPTMLIMMALMFVGGSPGGTAGGVKTVTIGVLMAALWTNVVGRKDAEAHGWEISSTLVYRAIAIFGSGVLLWFVLTFMLTVTQAISTRDIIFEATSTLATVGLSTGATGQLDEIGKCLIIIGMFVGRIGPLTLFVLLTQDPKVKRRSLPQAEIPLS